MNPDPVQVPIDILVCGQEELKPVQSLSYSFTVGRDPQVSMTAASIKFLFKNSNSLCGIKKVSLTTKEADEEISILDESFIKIDERGKLTILNKETKDNKKTYYIRAVTLGNVVAYQKISLIYKLNKTPKLSQEIPKQIIEVTGDDQKAGLDEKLFEFESPKIVDDEQDAPIIDIL